MKKTFLITLLFLLSPLASVAQTTGTFELTSNSEQIVGLEMAKSFSEIIKTDEKLNWAVHVPDNYKPTSSFGVVVYFSDKIPTKLPVAWSRSLKENNLIWISIKNSNNYTERKTLLSGLLSMPLIEQKYNINSERVYTIGYNSGCRTAGNLAKLYPNMIKGAIYINCDPTTWRTDTPPRVDLMQENRYYFIASPESSFKVYLRQAIKKYNNAGIEETKYKTIPGISRNQNIKRRHLNKAIEYLDMPD